MNKNKFILSLFFMLLIAIATNLFTEFINNRTENKEQELNILEEDLKYKQQTLEQIKNKIKITDDTYTSSSNEFKDKFGYDYNIPQEEEIRNFSLMKKEENKEIKENIKNLIINYKNYYEGSIYDSEFFDSYMSNFTSLTEDVNYEQYRDIAKDLKIDLFINKVEDGAIYYIKNRNKDKKNLNIYLLIYANYSSYLKFFADNEKVPITELYAAVVNLHNLCRKMESLSYDLGKLKSENLEYLANNLYELMKNYYGNMGIINSLE